MSKKLELEKAAESIASMVIEWVDGGIKMGTDWRPGLASIIQLRLDRVDTQSQLAALREELAKYKDGFFQKVTDEDLKKISDFVGDGDLPTQSFFMRPDAANLANMTMHMVREVQSMRLRLADAERRNAVRDAQLSKAIDFVERLCASAGNQPSIATGYLRDILDALNPNPEAASHDE